MSTYPTWLTKNVKWIAAGSLAAFLFCFFIFCMTFWVGVKKDEDDVDDYHDNIKYWTTTTCTYQNLATTPYQCADKVNCQCATCSGSNTCSAMVGSLTPGECCDGYHCCRTRPKYCSYWDACCYRSCSGTTKNRHCRCHGCMKRRQCGTECVEYVSNRRCEVAVGTCHNLKVDIMFDGYVGEATGHCARDQFQCVTNWQNSHANGTEWECHYDTRNPVGTVTNSWPEEPDKNPHHINASWVFGIASAIAFVVFLITGVMFAIQLKCRLTDPESVNSSYRSSGYGYDSDSYY